MANFEGISAQVRNVAGTTDSEVALQSSSHIRACTNCVRAKSKCSSPDEAGVKCSRCQRMNKVCEPSPPMRKRRTIAKRPNKKISDLEEKIDGLVSLVRSATQNPALPIAADIPQHPVHHNDSPMSYGESQLTHNASSSSSPPTLYQSSGDVFDIPYADAEAYYVKFKTSFLPHLPFVILPSAMSAMELHEARPMLWMSIMSVASTDTARQSALSLELRALFGKRAFVDGTRSLDFLLSVLVYTIWDPHHCFDRPIMTNLIQLALSIMYDLGLNKPHSKDVAQIFAHDLKGIPKPARFERSATMEERRALLTCFLIATGPYCLKKDYAVRWTSYFEECVYLLETQRDSPSDILFSQLVRIWQISERISDAWSRSQPGSDLSLRPPSMFYLKSLEKQIHDFKIQVPPELATNSTLLLDIYNTEISLYEIGLSQSPDLFSSVSNERIECLWSCLKAVKTWISIFLAIPPAQLFGQLFCTFARVSRCFVTVCLLQSFEHPEWNRRLVQETIDVHAFLLETMTCLSQVKDAAGLDIGCPGNMDIFSTFASKIRTYQSTWDSVKASSTLSGAVPPPGDGPIYDVTMPVMDEEWFYSTFGPVI